MLPLLLVGCGLALLALGLWLMRGMGRGYRIGRTLAAAPLVPVAEALELARRGADRYVRVHGRIRSDEEFPDDLDRPLVYRRRRLEVATGSHWAMVLDDREAVPFGVEERTAYIAVDADHLGEGLVVLPRVATGRAGEVPQHLPAGTDPASLTRFRVDQVSAVEQAHVAGRPTVGAGGVITMTAGLGRPLILTTLERAEAMRILGSGHGRRLRLAAVCLALGAASLVLAFLAVAVPAAVARAATPIATAAPSAAPSAAVGVAPVPIESPGDTRSSGLPPGVVGQPFVALGAVLGVAALAIGGAVAFGRVAGPPDVSTTAGERDEERDRDTDPEDRPRP